MGHGYNGEHFFSAEWAAMMGWTHAIGEDMISRSDFAHNTPAWYIYHYLPWETTSENTRTLGKALRTEVLLNRLQVRL